MSDSSGNAPLAVLAAAGAAFGFIVAPLIPFMNAGAFYAAGSLVAVGAAVMWQAAGLERPRWGNFGMAVVAAGVVIGTYQIQKAVRVSDAVQRTCLAIQRDMLAAKPKRADAPDVFTAMGCKPQVDG